MAAKRKARRGARKARSTTRAGTTCDGGYVRTDLRMTVERLREPAQRVANKIK
jgi:hypothetical protein